MWRREAQSRSWVVQQDAWHYIILHKSFTCDLCIESSGYTNATKLRTCLEVHDQCLTNVRPMSDQMSTSQVPHPSKVL